MRTYEKPKGQDSPHWKGGLDNYVPEPNTGCWLWLGAVSNGYGRALGGKLAHRLMYEREVGAVPDGLDLDHLCRVRSCVNPAHLEPVTRRENLLRGDTIPRRNAMRNTCANGHAYDYIDSNGSRHCRTCRNKTALAFYYSKRGKRFTD